MLSVSGAVQKGRTIDVQSGMFEDNDCTRSSLIWAANDFEVLERFLTVLDRSSSELATKVAETELSFQAKRQGKSTEGQFRHVLSMHRLSPTPIRA